MFFPFLVADRRSGLQFRLTDTTLADLTLAPRATPWSASRAIAETPHPVWAESFAHAPMETIAAVTASLEDLVLATPDLRVPDIGGLPESRAKRHLMALTDLWRKMGDALPEGLAAVRHALVLPQGHFLEALPVVAGSLDPFAPAAFQALFHRLEAEFGSCPAAGVTTTAAHGTRLHALQEGLTASALAAGPRDQSLAFFGLRDAAEAADFAAARARALMKAGVRARDIAVLTAGDGRHLARAFGAQGVPLSGLSPTCPERDLVGEAALHLARAKRSPTPAMVLASLALSPLMPWSAQTGRDLAETLMAGDFRGDILAQTPVHKALWDDIRAPASSLAQMRFLIDRICLHLPHGDQVRARLPLPAGDGPPSWEVLLRDIQVAQPARSDPAYILEGVSLWSAQQSPWRPCRHLIVTDFTDGHYPNRPRANPMFLDSEIVSIHATTGLSLRGRAEGLAQGISLFKQQLQAVSESVTFLIPWRDLAGGRVQPSAGLSLVARAIEGIEDAADLICDLSRDPRPNWPVEHYQLPPLEAPPQLPEALNFPTHSLIELRRRQDGTIAPQSPSRLETLIVSPFAWLLGEIGAADLSWSAEELDLVAKGNIAHDVFEQVFPAEETLPEAASLPFAVAAAFDRALSRHAAFLRSPSWEMERHDLEREILQAAQRWLAHLETLQAKIIGNEIWLSGEAHGITLHGKADSVLELPDRTLLVIDHKKSSTSGRRKRMEAGWDLQAGLYADMIARPYRREGDAMGPLIGRKVAIGYHLMNDGGLLTSGVALPDNKAARDLGDQVNTEAIALLSRRLAELGAGRVVLNTTDDADFFRKTAGFTPYALTDGSILVTAFIRQIEEE